MAKDSGESADPSGDRVLAGHICEPGFMANAENGEVFVAGTTLDHTLLHDEVPPMKPVLPLGLAVTALFASAVVPACSSPGEEAADDGPARGRLHDRRLVRRAPPAEEPQDSAGRLRRRRLRGHHVRARHRASSTTR